MTSTKISTAIIAGALLLIGLGGCSQASAATRELGGVPDAVPTGIISLAPQAQDMPGAPIPSATSDPTEPVAVPTTGAPADTAAAPATVKAATATKAATTKAVAPKTTAPAAPKTTVAPVNTYKPPSTAGILTLSCTWNGIRVVSSAQWSGATEIVITASAPGMSATSGRAVSGYAVNGTAGLHGACTASGGGQSKSGNA